VARILIVGGGCRGLDLASRLLREGHAVRMTTRGEANRARIEATGAECWVGSPDRLATLRGSLESVTIACWLLARANGAPDQLRALHGSRLEFFLGQLIDTTVRGFVYEAGAAPLGAAPLDAASEAAVPRDALARGERIVRALGERNAIPTAVLSADPGDIPGWLADASAAIDSLLDRPRARPALS
jgi:hypothetical protein